MNSASPASPAQFEGVWLDALAFLLGLACAWVFGWSTTDLVWSLWLSSLVVGYAMIVWSVSSPLRGVLAGTNTLASIGGEIAATTVVGFGTLFVLGFFTVHFGGFHYVHSMFLNHFFPLKPGVRNLSFFAMIGEALRRYWWFLPAAAIAERQAFQKRPAPGLLPVTADDLRQRMSRSNSMMEPYQNVLRMHLLIFFFAFASFVRLTNFAVFAVAYAAYFFPWRVLKRPASVTGAT